MVVHAWGNASLALHVMPESPYLAFFFAWGNTGAIRQNRRPGSPLIALPQRATPRTRRFGRSWCCSQFWNSACRKIVADCIRQRPQRPSASPLCNHLLMRARTRAYCGALSLNQSGLDPLPTSPAPACESLALRRRTHSTSLERVRTARPFGLFHGARVRLIASEGSNGDGSVEQTEKRLNAQ